MQILIKDKDSLSWSRENYLHGVAGTWLNVETEHLFNNQYNTGKFRVMDCDIQAIKDDIRPFKSKCGYCGTVVNKGEKCNKYRHKTHYDLYVNNNQKSDCDKYKMQEFTEKNCFFVANPNGIQITVNEWDKLETFGTYVLSARNGFYTLQNSRHNIKFSYDPKTRLFWTESKSFKWFNQLNDFHLNKMPSKIEDDIRNFFNIFSKEN